MKDFKDEKRSLVLSDRKAFQFLFQYTKGLRLQLYLGVLCLIIATALNVYVSYLISIIINDGVLKQDYETGLYYGISLIIYEIISIVFLYFGRRLLAKIGTKTIYKIRKSMFRHLNHLPMSYYDKTPQGRVATRLTHDVEDLEHFFSSSLGRLGAAFLMAIFAWTAILFTNIELGIFISLSTIPTVLITIMTRKKVRDLNWDLSKKNAAINAQLSEYIQGLGIIRSFGLENYSKEKYDQKVKDHLSTAKSMNKFYTFIRPITSFVSQFPLIVLIIVGGSYALTGSISIGIIITYFRYVEQFTSPIELISREIHVLQQAFTSADRVAQFLIHQTEEDIFKPKSKLSRKLEGEIQFDNVSMYYNPEEWVLNNINFHIKKGQTIGFLGRTGSGKTTTLALLSRLYPFQKGHIYMDGIDIQDWDLLDLRRQIGFVSQDIFLFRGSLRENLSLHKKFNDKELIQAAKESGLWDILQKHGRDLDFELIGNGENFSAGERQLISICRTLLHDPKILIFDEATSHIDPELEAIIQNTLSRVAKKRTTLIIAHRLHTLNICDELYVFKDGRIIAKGSHDELITSSSYYKKLYSFS